MARLWFCRGDLLPGRSEVFIDRSRWSFSQSGVGQGGCGLAGEKHPPKKERQDG
jgi:hypothetical protein